MKNYLDRFTANSVLIPSTEYSTLGTSSALCCTAILHQLYQTIFCSKV